MVLWPWVEVARTPEFADAHPEWMAAPGGHHDDWRRRFPAVPKAQAGAVIKAWPWVPIGYEPAFNAHRERLRALLENLPGLWPGVFLNDLQAGPSSCGCGNDQCRWALDYGTPATTAETPGDDAAARVVSDLRTRFPGKMVIPVWVTECETVDLPDAKNGSGLCGSVPCADRDCWPRYVRTWNPLVKAADGPIAVALWPETFRRDPDSWIDTGLALFQKPPRGGTPLAPEKTIAIVQAWNKPDASVADLLSRMKRWVSGWVLALDPIDQSWEPRAVRLSPEPRTVFRPEMFETLVNPACSHCIDESRRKAGELRDDDRVLSWIRGKYDGGAIPYRWFLIPYRVISDTYGVFVYDADADFVRGFPASLDYRFHGWRNGVMVMKHKDGTLFDCLTGVAFAGPRQGEHLTPIPTIESNWGAWLKTNPGTVAYAMVSKFQPQSAPKSVLQESQKTRPELDGRLGAEERVFGLAIERTSKAWPLTLFGEKSGLRNETLGGKKIVILWDSRTRTAAAYAPETEGDAAAPVTLAVQGGGLDFPWVDQETSSRWSIAGRAVFGPRKGQTLRWLPGVVVKWYAWSAEYPKTLLASDKSHP